MTENSATDLPTTGSATVDVNASAQDVYALLTDLERLPALSPENQRCEFLADATAIDVGVRFRGHNKSGDYEWHADCEVTVADEAKRLPTSCRLTSSTPRRGDTTLNRPALTPARSPSGSTPRCSRCPMCTQAKSMVGAKTSRRRAGPRWKTYGQRSLANAASEGSREPGSPRAALFRIGVLQVILRTHLDKPVRLLKSLDHSHGQRTFGRRSHDRF